MEWGALSGRAMEYIQKYRYVLLLVLIGILLLSFPKGSEETQIVEEPLLVDTSRTTLQDALAQILGKIEGAGKVEVLLAEKEGEQVLYQTNEQSTCDQTSSNIRKETVLITGNSRSEEGLIVQINPPKYQGAVILCQGADRAQIRLAIVEAVMGATGLTSDKITVLKMK